MTNILIVLAVLAGVGLLIYLVRRADSAQARAGATKRQQNVEERQEQKLEQAARVEHDEISATFDQRRQGDLSKEIAQALKRDKAWPGKPSD